MVRGDHSLKDICQVIRFPKAKINLGLRVLRKRSDGYHDIQSLLYPIPLSDVLETIPSSRGMVYDFGDWQEDPRLNLVTKAYFLFKERNPELPSVEIILRKNIPTGAGLGGGSSDATNMLLLLDELFSLKTPAKELHEMATKLGADCPFFLSDQPQIAEGIGEKLSPYPLDLRGKVLTLLLSDLHISTAEAYAGVKLSEQVEDIRDVLQRPITEWRDHLVNDFEEGIFKIHPTLAEGKRMLYDVGAEYAVMSGSGPTLFALSNKALEIENWQGKILTYTL